MDTATFSYLNVAEIEVTYKNKVNPSDRPKITRSQDCYELLKSVWNMDKIEYVEEFYIVLLNRANRVLGVTRISEGSMSGCIVDPKRVFQTALKGNASGIILSHNHPSCSVNPSTSDLNITNKIKNAGEFLEISVLDHLIITPYEFFSFSDNGML